MNYKAHYDSLIWRARNRILNGYAETHHVVPKCLGGTDKATNLVRLTPNEHFVAHELLVKMYPSERGLTVALMLMSGAGRGNKLYAWHRRRAASFMIGNTHTKGRKMPPLRPEAIAKMAASKRGRVITPEWRAKISATKTLRTA